MKESIMLSHAVYFTMKDKGSIDSLIDSCRAHLTDHPGAISFAVGRCATEYDRHVNDRSFDVALEIIFESTAAHDTYQTSDRHQQFIGDNAEKWAQVRVFDVTLYTFEKA
jgi:hypothetical protein